ncbi:MAG: glutamate-1-semialdehyde 2,1-aminomutase [Chthoniobacterales bacterium]
MDSNSSRLFAAARQRIPGGVNSPVRAFRGLDCEPFFVERASGAKIWDVDGNEYIDYVGTWGPAILGHAPRVVTDAVRAAAEKGVSFGIPNPLEVEMAELICAWVPSIEKVRMVNSGTEATMSCVRLARGFTGRDKIIKFEGCYHGHVDSLLVHAGSGALTHGEPDSAGVPAAFAGLTISLPFNDIAAVRAAFRENKGEIAAIILEPIPANAGLYLPKENFLQQLRDECTKAGALLIFDEVMTGCRVARGGAQELYGIRPDLTALGKVIGGGLPVGAFGGRAEIMNRLSPDGPVYQAGTLSGNPLAMAAGLAQLRELERIDGWRILEDLGAQLETAMREIMRQTKQPLTFHRLGSMFCLFFSEGPVTDLASAKRSDRAAFAQFFRHCLAHGIYFAPSQFETGFLSTAHSADDLAQTAAVVRKSFASDRPLD